MKRWSKTHGQYRKFPEIDAFLAEVLSVCKKHGMSISHEDTHGAFVVEQYSEERAEWLQDAHEAIGKH